MSMTSELGEVHKLLRVSHIGKFTALSKKRDSIEAA
jgi:hypothetical protein